jgi:FkbM family methyltransferase
MNWKLKTGQIAEWAEQSLIKSGNGFINRNFPFGRDWLFDLKRTLKEHPSVIVDVGANEGSITQKLNNWFPEAHIYAFEPVTATFQLLQRNTVKLRNVSPIVKALGKANTKANIFLYEDNTISSFNASEQGIARRHETVEVVRLDAFMNEHSLSHVDILKIDVEGAEFDVLEGCGNFLAEGINCIYLEVGYEREPTKVHFSNVDQFMEKNGFVIRGIYETRRNLFDKSRLWYSNNLYIKKTLIA